MSLNVIDLIKGQLGPALVSQAATQYGESESGISKAISGLLPAVVGGMANNANQPALLDAITGSQSTGLLGNLLGGSSNNSLVSSVLSAIFGDKINGLINAVSGYSGVSNSTSGSLLNMVAGAALGSLGKYAADHNLDRNSLSGLLSDQKGIVSSLLPAGLSLASLGLGNWGGTPDVATEKVKVTSYDEPKVEVNRGGNTHVNVDRKDDNEAGSIWKWLLPLLLLALAAWFLWKQCNKPAEQTTATTDSTAVVTDSVSTMMPTDSAMVTTNKVDDDTVLKDTWYTFDKVNFKMGSSTELEAGSQVQLDNLVAILKAYPDAKIKVGGYTDKVGDEANNVKLSTARANYIKSALEKAGVGAQVIGAEGYGSKFATVAATASDAERAIDRKMAVRFAK